MVMRYVKVFRSLSKFVLHPLIHTFSSEKNTAISGEGSERAKVGIKVCNSHSRWTVRRGGKENPHRPYDQWGLPKLNWVNPALTTLIN